MDQGARVPARVARSSEVKKAPGSAMVSAGLLLSRQGPCGLPAVFAVKSRPTPRRPRHADRNGGLVDEDQPGRMLAHDISINSSSAASAPPNANVSQG
jgi:hypothetical protein